MSTTKKRTQKEKDAISKKRSRTKNMPTSEFNSGIQAVRRQVWPDLTLSKYATSALTNIMQDLLGKVALESANLARKGKRMTVSSLDVQTAARILLPGGISKYAVIEGTKAVTNYMSSQPGTKGKGKKVSSQKRAKLVFSIGKARRELKLHSQRVGAGAPIYAAAVCEYILAEILELAGKHTVDVKRNRIRARDVAAAIQQDNELEILFRGTYIARGGVTGLQAVEGEDGETVLVSKDAEVESIRANKPQDAKKSAKKPRAKSTSSKKKAPAKKKSRAKSAKPAKAATPAAIKKLEVAVAKGVAATEELKVATSHQAVADTAIKEAAKAISKTAPKKKKKAPAKKSGTGTKKKTKRGRARLTAPKKKTSKKKK